MTPQGMLTVAGAGVTTAATDEATGAVAAADGYFGPPLGR